VSRPEVKASDTQFTNECLVQ